jgi:hypothetical protein
MVAGPLHSMVCSAMPLTADLHRTSLRAGPKGENAPYDPAWVKHGRVGRVDRPSLIQRPGPRPGRLHAGPVYCSDTVKMADFYPLIARAVAGLDKNTGDSRRALYEGARAALVAHLRGLTPAMDESDVTRERLSLEDAIRKVERESARQSTSGRETARFKSPEFPRWKEPEAEPPAQSLEPAPRSPRVDPLAKLARLIGQSDPFADLARFQSNATADFARETLQPSVRRAKLAEVASPAPFLASDGRLDAGPNVTYDAPGGDDDLRLLLRQRALIKTIVDGLPGNAPKQLRSALESYDDELKVRGVQPILGLLKDMAAIIEADASVPDANQDWFQKGMRKPFNLFAENHALVVARFLLDPEREELYANTTVDEDKASGLTLSAPFEAVASATLDANKVGLTTDNFLKIVNKLAEFAKVTSTMPPPSLPSRIPESRDQEENPLTAGAEDRIAGTPPIVSARKRVLLSGFGFFERVYNLVASTATLRGTPEGMALLAALGDALSDLVKLIGF